MKTKDFKYIVLHEENGILFLSWKVEHINLEIAKRSVEDRIKATEGREVLVLSDATSIKSMTKEAREHLAKNSHINVKKGAVLVNSTLSKLVVNFCIMIHKPKVEMKSFECAKIALTWLKL